MSDPNIRLSFFLGGLIIFSSLEFFFSYRKRNLSRTIRWPANLGIIFLSSIIIKLLIPAGLIVFANNAASSSIGLFNIIDLSFSLELVLSVILLDLCIYFQHVLTHKVDFLWKIHRVHHADIDLDATSALRFHPFEIIISLFL